LKNYDIELINAGYDIKKIKKYFEENKEIWNDINLSKISVYYFTKDTKDRFFATRKSLDSSFNKDKIENSITDTGIQKILLRFLESKENNPEVAFSPEGIEELNLNIKKFNNGKDHQPILKVRVYEKAEKFSVGQTGNKKEKFVEAAKGTNLFFGVYQKNSKNPENKNQRNFETIPLNIVVDRLKKNLSPVPEINEDGDKLLLYLSPNDLVYVPSKEENINNIFKIENYKILKIVSFSGKRLYGIPYFISTVISDKLEFTLQNKIELITEKNNCIPIKVDRLGRVISIFRKDD